MGGSVKKVPAGSPSQLESTRDQHTDDPDNQALPIRQLLVPKVLIAIGCHSLVAAMDVGYRAVQPLFFSTPISLGGLGLPVVSIGQILFAAGVTSAIFMLCFFSRIHDRWGPKVAYITGVACLIPCFALFPIANLLARNRGMDPLVWVVIGVQVLLSVGTSMSFGEF